MNYETFEGFKKEDSDLSILIDSRGAQRTASLFLETSVKERLEKFPPIYTLRNREYNGLPSAYLIYMSSVDEYDAAMKIVGSMSHWRKLLNCKWFMEGITFIEGLEQWRIDMALRDASMAKGGLIRATKTGDTSSARRLLDMSEIKSKNPVGRPKTKEAKKADELAQAQEEEAAAIELLHRQTLGETSG